MERKKKLPIGIEFFKDFRRDNFYYVDKTGFIRDLVDMRGLVNLFTRPRRFGKSLNMDMLKTFFEIGTDPSCFEGLEISRERAICEEHMGKYPVISITLKGVEGRSFQTAYDMLGIVVSTEARRFKSLLDSDRLMPYEKEKLYQMMKGDFGSEAELQDSLRLLTELLSEHYGKQVIVLIDEYDVPLDKAYQMGYYQEMVSLIRALFSQTLKTNSNLYFAVITGCLRIAKESIFTGLNNFKVRTISDTDFAEYFGFTDKEVRDMLSYYGVEDSFDEIKEWYDGYHFGETNVYCPWDVLNQCDKLRVSGDAPMEAYWENSSSNIIVKDIIANSTATTRNQIEALISGESIEKVLIPELTYTDLENEDQEVRQTYLWTDVQKPENRLHRLMIPNREILGIYTDKIRSWFHTKIIRNTARWNNFCNAVKTGNAAGFQTLFNEIMSESISIRDTFARKEMKENFYHGMLLGLLQTVADWIVRSNLESGIGYTDILIEIPAEKAGCIIETKYAENGAFDTECREAMRQIEDNNYIDLLKQHGMQEIHAYGVSCYKKTCMIVHRRID